MKSKTDIKLYNPFFPFWDLWLIPRNWLVFLPANFLLDTIVFLSALKLLNLPIMKTYRKSIIKIWLFGFLSDIFGGMWLETLNHVVAKASVKFGSLITYYLSEQTGLAGFAFLLSGVAISSLFIYFFNLKISFKNLDLDNKQKKRLALVLAIFTAPYSFFVTNYVFFA
jgi:hypothetical protein